jgi:hypothetical protein
MCAAEMPHYPALLFSSFTEWRLQMVYQDWRSFIFATPEKMAYWLPKLEAVRQAAAPKNYRQVVNKLDLIDFDREFALDPEPHVLAAGFENSEGEEFSLEDVKQMFQTSDGSLNFVATCKCGYLRGNYNEGTTCPRCKTKCKTSFASEVSFGGWLVIPESLPPLLHPAVYRVLRNWMGKLFKRKDFVLDAILNPDVELTGEYAKLGQGMTYFYQNFDDIINFVMSIKGRGQKAKSDGKIREFIDTWRHLMFVRHIPILNQSLHVQTKTGTMTYTDKSSEFIIKTYLELSSTIYTLRHRPDTKPSKLQKKIWTIFESWMTYCQTIIVPKLAKKEGFIRKNVNGHRAHMSARAVIIPITSDHNPDEIEIPWRMTVGLYKLEIMNVLQNRYGYDVREACELWNRAIVTYTTVVDNCLKTLLNECPFRGFPILMGRNPELMSAYGRQRVA